MLKSSRSVMVRVLHTKKIAVDGWCVPQELRKEKAQFEREATQLRAQLDFKNKAIEELSSLSGGVASSSAPSAISPNNGMDPVKALARFKTENEELQLKVRC
jgi:hypothetical protein